MLSQADPYLCLVKARYGRAPAPAMTRAGSLCPEWAERLGLPAGIAVSGSSFDAHAGAVGASIQIDDLIAVGGISQKSAYIMQLIADMLGKKFSILDADQTCAIGAAMYAAVAAGIYAGAPEAGAHMAARVIETFDPNEARREAYEAPYQAYLRLAAFQEHASSHQGCGTSAEKKDSL